MLTKGTFLRAPFIPFSTKVEYVQKQSYIAGWIGHHRPLNAIEMSQIYFNLIQINWGEHCLWALVKLRNLHKSVIIW